MWLWLTISDGLINFNEESALLNIFKCSNLARYVSINLYFFKALTLEFYASIWRSNSSQLLPLVIGRKIHITSYRSCKPYNFQHDFRNPSSWCIASDHLQRPASDSPLRTKYMRTLVPRLSSKREGTLTVYDSLREKSNSSDCIRSLDRFGLLL